MITVGLTGGIASGKTTLAEHLRQRGARVIDADSVAHAVMAPNQPAYGAIVDHFGPEVLAPDGAIDRAKLGAIVFRVVRQREALNALVHPYVADAVRGQLDQLAAELAPDDLVILVVPLLIESGMIDLVDRVVVVLTTPEQQLDRLLARGLSEDEAVARIRAQIPDTERLAHADHVVINKSTPEVLEQTADELLQRLRQR